MRETNQEKRGIGVVNERPDKSFSKTSITETAPRYQK